jgi:Uma2 family endonuclease
VSIIHAPTQQCFILHGVPWRTYERLLRVFADRPGMRVTYDRGTLELMTLSHEHERNGYLLARLVDALTEELGLPVKGGGSTTFRQRKRHRGLEPDGCWWIASEALVRGKLKIDLRRDPPPDLGLEIDVSHSSLDRLEIYSALRIPEVWRLDGGALICHILGNDGLYFISPTSRVFPGLAPADLMPFVALRGQMDENAIVRQFRAWARLHLLPSGTNPPSP